MLTRMQRAAGALAVAVLLAACAAQVPVTPATLARLDRPVEDFTVPESVRIELPTGRARALPAGSVWRAVGTLPQGVVYQPVGTVFTVVGRNVHEAYLVVQGTTLQGFYLPGEHNFSPLSNPLSLPLSKGAKP
jgi:hypothetical protein